MNHITNSPRFEAFKADVKDNWKMATDKDIIDAYTIATAELGDLYEDGSVAYVAANMPSSILMFASDELATAGDWFCAPVSCLINALSLAIERCAYINPQR